MIWAQTAGQNRSPSTLAARRETARMQRSECRIRVPSPPRLEPSLQEHKQDPRLVPLWEAPAEDARSHAGPSCRDHPELRSIALTESSDTSMPSLLEAEIPPVAALRRRHRDAAY